MLSGCVSCVAVVFFFHAFYVSEASQLPAMRQLLFFTETLGLRTNYGG